MSNNPHSIKGMSSVTPRRCALGYFTHRKYVLLVCAAVVAIFTWDCDFLELLTSSLPPDPTLEEIEEFIRRKHDGCAVFTYEEYRTLLQELSKPSYHVLPLQDFRLTFDTTLIIVGLRHDVDRHPFKAMEIAAIETLFNIRSTFYILHTADYYGDMLDTAYTRYEAMGELYQNLYQLAGEIGIHNNLLEMMMKYAVDPLAFQLAEIDFYESLGIPIYGSAAHGSGLVEMVNLSNQYIYSDFHDYGTFTWKGNTYEYGKYSLEDFGLEYEAYALPYDKFLSESGGAWHNGSLGDIILFLQSCKNGDRVQILTHPMWWGK